VSPKKTSSKDFVEIEISKLKSDPVNKTVYGEEEPDMDLVNSIQEKGLLEPIIIDDNNVIVSGHRRWLALKYLATTDNKWMKIKCLLMHFENERERALRIIEFNPRKGKSFSRIYNEMKMLHAIYDPEALEASLSNLRQYTDMPKLACRRIMNEAVKKGYLDPQRIDSTLTDEENFNNLIGYLRPILDKHNEKRSDKALGATRDLIARQVGLGRTNSTKIYEIGSMAEQQDEIAILAMKNLDEKKWKIGSAHNVIRVRKIQNRGDRGHGQASLLITKIKNGETKPSEAGKFLKALTGGIKVTDGEPYDVLLLKPEGNPDQFKIRPLPLHKKSVLFWLTPAIYLNGAIRLLEQWGFSYQSCTPVYASEDDNSPWFHHRHDLLLLYTINNYVPTEIAKFTEIIQSITDIYDAIDTAFPKKTKYDVLSQMKFGVPSENKEKDNTYASPAADGEW
jgi:ParB-like nuclease domain